MTDIATKLPPDEGHITHTHIGGQAVLEGIMMRGKFNWAVAVRTSTGDIHTEAHDLPVNVHRQSWLKWPIVRGCVAMVDTLSLAMKAFSVSASLAGDTEEEQLSAKEIAFTMVFGVGLAILFFIILPAVATNFLGRFVPISMAENPLRWNIVDGILRVVAFFLYIWAIGRMADIQRVFGYHGAEHKTIHAYEHNLPLETSLIQRYSTSHVRCGTSFLLMVMIVAIIVFSLTPVKAIAYSMGIDNRIGVLVIAIMARLVLMPLVAGLAYEITVKWAGNHSENPIVGVLLWPGLQMQKMTTREPDDGMVEVAVAAMQPIIAREERESRIAAGEEPDLEPAPDDASEPAPAPGDATAPTSETTVSSTPEDATDHA